MRENDCLSSVEPTNYLESPPHKSHSGTLWASSNPPKFQRKLRKYEPYLHLR